MTTLQDIQRRVGVPADGKWGPQTASAVAHARSVKNEAAIVKMRVSNSDRLARIETKRDRILEERK